MKTLKKLQLNDAKVLSNSEMKHILGGTGAATTDGGSGTVVGNICYLGAACVVVVLDDWGNKKSEVSGTCQGHMSNNTVTCYCSAGGSGGNVNGVSHCTKGL